MDAHRLTSVSSGQLTPPQALTNPSATTPIAATAALNAIDTQVEATPATSAGDDDEDDELVMDSRRNWSHDVTLTLVRIWKRVCQAQPQAGRVERMQAVYDEFKEAVDCSNRSLKAVEDKLYTTKQMYQFIVKMNSSVPPRQQHQHADQKNEPTWFTLTKEERRAVRSLHRIRVPNISLEIFKELDSVLNPELILTPQEKQLKQQINQILYQGQGDAPVDTYGASIVDQRVVNEAEFNGDGTSDTKDADNADNAGNVYNADIVDAKRNWSHEVTLHLAKAWHAATLVDGNARGVTLNQRVYTEFIKAVGGSSRSRKAVEDKMHSMKEMYRFINSYDGSCVSGSGKTPWFELKKPERRQLKALHKIRVPNLTPEIYAELDAFMKKNSDGSTKPVAASLVVEANGSSSTVAQTTAPASSTTETDTTRLDRAVLPSESAEMTLASSYEILRRLADEESRLTHAPFNHTNQTTYQQSLQQTYQQPRPLNSVPMPYATAPSDFQIQQQPESGEPLAKRPRTNTDNANDERLQQLLALQKQSIVERRQHHAEQMAVLGQILGLLQSRTHQL